MTKTQLHPIGSWRLWCSIVPKQCLEISKNNTIVLEDPISLLPCAMLICSSCPARHKHADYSCSTLAGVLLVAAAMPTFSLAATLASRFGVLAVLPVLPLLWLLFGCLLCLGTVVLKKLLMPALEEGRFIAMWSADFARWWLVHRAIGMTNHLFARHLRGTAFLPAFFRALVRGHSTPSLSSASLQCCACTEIQYREESSRPHQGC